MKYILFDIYITKKLFDEQNLLVLIFYALTSMKIKD